MATKKEVVEKQAGRRVIQMEPCRYHDDLTETLLRIEERIEVIISLLNKEHSV